VSCAIMSFVCGVSAQTNERRVKSLAGTTWSGTDSDGDYYVFTFEQDGTLAYRSPTGSYKNGKWNQFKNALYIETNDHYSEYLGRINGNIIQGKAWNKEGRVWRWKVSKNTRALSHPRGVVAQIRKNKVGPTRS
jgi:hypothetical protein